MLNSSNDCTADISEVVRLEESLQRRAGQTQCQCADEHNFPQSVLYAHERRRAAVGLDHILVKELDGTISICSLDISLTPILDTTGLTSLSSLY